MEPNNLKEIDGIIKEAHDLELDSRIIFNGQMSDQISKMNALDLSSIKKTVISTKKPLQQKHEKVP